MDQQEKEAYYQEHVKNERWFTDCEDWVHPDGCFYCGSFSHPSDCCRDAQAVNEYWEA
jgi:hypothetical protein